MHSWALVSRTLLFTSHGGRRRPRGHDRGLDDGCGGPARTATPPPSEPSRRSLTSLPCAGGTSALPRAAEFAVVSGTRLLGQHLLDDRVIRSNPRRQDRQDPSVEVLGLGVPPLAGVGFGHVIE